MGTEPENPSQNVEQPASDPQVSSPQASEPRVLGDFELRREIGRGGMGTVYEAWQRSLKRTVAVKVLGQHVSSSPTAVIRFHREAQAAAKLHHPHIVPIFALGEERGTYYYAMEYIDGPGLNTIIADKKACQTADTNASDLAETVPLKRESGDGDQEARAGDSQPSAEGPGRRDSSASLAHLSGVCSSDEHFTLIAQHMCSIADALGYAHQQGVIHRDIKPHNLIVGSDGKMSISDFGLARLAEQPGVTVTGEMLGSPLYMSPEQVSGSPAKVDHRTDICSLGVTMYEWLTLQPPYPGETREQVISRILTSEPLPPRAHNANIPLDLETICLKAIERDRRRRYQAAAELRDDLRRFIANQPIKARRDSLPIRLKKFVARHQLASLGTAAALVALVLGLALVKTRRQVATQTAVTQEAEKVLDLFSKLPLELSAPLRFAEAAPGVLRDVIQGGLEGASAATTAQAGGADPAASRTPVGIAQRATREFYEVIAPEDWPGAGDGSGESTALLTLALERVDAEPGVASELVDAHLLTHPDDFEARQMQVSLWGRLGQYDKMLEESQELVRLHPEDAHAYTWRGLSHLLLKDSGSSLSDLDRAQQIGGSPSWIALLMGLALAHEGRSVEAISAFDDALEIEPDFVVALLGRASARGALGNTTGAVTDLTQVIELAPDDADTIALRGDRYVEMNDYEAAERDYLRAMDVAGQSALMVVRYLFALSKGGGAARIPAALPQPTEGAEVDVPAVEPDEGSSSSESPAEWLPREETPHPPMVTYQRPRHAAAHRGLYFGGLGSP